MRHSFCSYDFFYADKSVFISPHTTIFRIYMEKKGHATIKNKLSSTELENLSVLLCLICVRTLTTLNNPVILYNF